jgi:SAM-dependent methyltransferase
MKNSKDSVAKFFGDESSDYLRHQYTQGADSFMALRRERAAGLIRTYLAPFLGDSFRFLDAGCGPGILLEVLGRYPIQYVGIDISQQMLALARRQGAHCVAGFRCELLQADVEQLPFPAGCFDAAASLGVIEYLNDDAGLLAELSRVTVPNGFVLLAVTNRYAYNLMLEKVLLALRKSRFAARLLSGLKSRLGRGEFKQRGFTIRRHSTRQFLRQLEEHDLQPLAQAYWGFNFLPHPLHFLCGRRLNRLANRLYDTVSWRPLRALGEGFIVLCQKQAAVSDQGRDRSVSGISADLPGARLAGGDRALRAALELSAALTATDRKTASTPARA